MNGVGPGGKSRIGEIAGVLARWILGALFLYMGLKKAAHPVEFLKLARQYDIARTPMMLDAVGAILPWFESACGALLLLGVAVRGVALITAVELIAFTAMVWHRAVVLQTASGLPFCAVKFDCGCGAGEVYICRKLTENFLLTCAALFLLTGCGRAFCLRHTLFRRVSEKLS